MRHKVINKESHFDVQNRFDVDYDLLYIITNTHTCEDGKISYISDDLSNEKVTEYKWFREVIRLKSEKNINFKSINVIRLAGFDLSGNDGISRDLLEFCKSFDTENTLIYSILEVEKGNTLPVHLLKYFAMSKFYGSAFQSVLNPNLYTVVSVFMNNFATRYISDLLVEKNYSYIMK